MAKGKNVDPKKDGSSAEVVKLMSSILANKSLQATDIRTMEDARKEIKRIRKLMENFQTTKGAKVGAGTEAGQAKKGERIALNEGEAIKNYVKKSIPKSDQVRNLLLKAIKPNALFEMNSDDELNELIDVFEPVSVEMGDIVIRQGEMGDTFYVVERGELTINISMMKDDETTQAHSVHDVRVGFYGEGSTFGELALMYGSPRAATIIAKDDCKLWQIKRNWYRGVIGQYRQKLHNEKLEFLPKVKVGDKKFGDVFRSRELATMAQLLKIEEFKKGSVIIREGEEGSTFYMIKKGEVEIFKEELGDTPIAKFGVQKFFGEKALLSDDTRQATCIAANDVVCYVLTRDDFNRVLGSLQDILDGKVKGRKLRSDDLVAKKKVSYNLSDLTMLNVLGEGAFGKVRLVQAKDSKVCYALKAQGKFFIVKNRQQDYVMYEYNIMKELNHPNIAPLHCAMQDKKYIYFLMDLLPGGEVMEHLQDRGEFSESWVKFYSASVVLAFDELHYRHIAYRDLKPENMVLDARGFCCIVDLGLAKKCEGPTYTFCGTPDYLAPEIIRGVGYDWGVDYWGLGVLLFELHNGSPPFASYDTTGTTKKILKGRVNFPTWFSSGIQDLIRRLLVLDQSRRLGRLQGGSEDVMRHRFYSGFDWEGLLEKRIQPPFEPRVPKNVTKIGKPDKGIDKAKESDWFPTL